MRIFIFRHNKALIARNRFGGHKRSWSRRCVGPLGNEFRVVQDPLADRRAEKRFTAQRLLKKLHRAERKDAREEAEHHYREAQAERHQTRIAPCEVEAEKEIKPIETLPAVKLRNRFHESSVAYRRTSHRHWLHGARVLASHC